MTIQSNLENLPLPIHLCPSWIDNDKFNARLILRVRNQYSLQQQFSDLITDVMGAYSIKCNSAAVVINIKPNISKFMLLKRKFSSLIGIKDDFIEEEMSFLHDSVLFGALFVNLHRISEFSGGIYRNNPTILLGVDLRKYFDGMKDIFECLTAALEGGAYCLTLHTPFDDPEISCSLIRKI